MGDDAGMYRICFVCSGNICRSPVAESVVRAHLDAAGLGDRVEVDSAGTGDWHVGADAHGPALASLRRRGYDLDHSARQFDRRWFAERDLVVALDRGHLGELRRLAPDEEAAEKVVLLRSFDPAAGGQQDVPDPYYGDESDFEHVMDLVEAAAPGLVAHVRGELDRT
jgi:protein-tyrosine phosphatase